MESLYQRLGPHFEVGDLVELGVEGMPEYDPYENKLQNAKTFPVLNEEPEVTPKLGEQYVNAEILLLRGDKMARGQVVCQRHDANVERIGCENIFRSRGSNLRLPAEMASMHALNGQLAKYKLKVLHTKVYPPWYSSGEST